MTHRENIFEQNCDGLDQPYDGYPGYHINNSVAVLIVWFFVILLVTWLAIYALSPSIVMRKDSREIDSGKALLASAIFAFLLVLIIWVVLMITH